MMVIVWFILLYFYGWLALTIVVCGLEKLFGRRS